MPHNEKGQEIVDQRPVAMPLGYKQPEPLADTIRRLIRVEASEFAKQQGEETFEEADDFEIGEDYDPHSPYELEFDQEIYKEDKNPTFKEETPSESKKNNMTLKNEETKKLDNKGPLKKTSSVSKEEEGIAPEGVDIDA